MSQPAYTANNGLSPAAGQAVPEKAGQTLRITEIFYSLQGEARTVGLPTVFVRLTGCPLRCLYCDTEYAFSGGELFSIDEIAGRVAGFAPRYVTVTGGEPLAQKTCLPLLVRLCDAGYEVSLGPVKRYTSAQVYNRPQEPVLVAGSVLMFAGLVWHFYIRYRDRKRDGRDDADA
jgi:hypothetical protein